MSLTPLNTLKARGIMSLRQLHGAFTRETIQSRPMWIFMDTMLRLRKKLFEEFLKWAMNTHKKGVLIVHGRGLCSPSEPVLKKKVEEWLTRGPWRKWVVAYSSARICDGGAGATYVLLRERPVSKRFKLGKWKLKKAQDHAT